MTTTTIEAYPLTWPEGWPRKMQHQRMTSPYRVTMHGAAKQIVRELKLDGARDIVISTNVPAKLDGTPYARMAEPKDPGVAVYWTDRDREPRVIAIDCWRTVRENMRAVGMAIASLRTFERTGAKEVQRRAYTGFARLPAGGDHWATLGLARGSSVEQIMGRYRDLAREHHPDRGGSAQRFDEISKAMQAAIREVSP
jgi:hypothetical protein